MKNAQLINQDSGYFEYYTPGDIVELARKTMGGIDLDPASSEEANLRVKATQFFSQNGLDRPWFGRVWMNHPFSRVNNKLWIEKLVNEYHDGNLSAACCITFAATSEAWFGPLLNYPQCFIHGRTNYFLADGTLKRGVTKGSVVTYLGTSPDRFATFFSKIGTVK